MDTAQWPQEIVVKPIEEIVTKPSAAVAVAEGGGGGLDQNRKTRGPQKEQALNCPRCNSTNTKFCYYNNYSLTQPRYFCKTCRRYWTEGGSLRNIPVGGGSRKNKRSSSSSPNSTSSSYNNTNNPSSKKLLTGHNSHHIQDHHDHHQNPSMIQQDHQGQDLNLAFPSTTAGTTTTTGMIRSFSELMQLPNIINDNSSSGKNQISAMELLTGISSASRGLTSFPMQDPTTHMVFTPGFPVMNHQDFKPSLNFSLDGIDQNSTATGSYGVQESDSNNGMIRSLFPFEDLKNVSSTTTTTATTAAAAAAEHGGDHSGYWTGMLGGGSW